MNPDYLEQYVYSNVNHLVDDQEEYDYNYEEFVNKMQEERNELRKIKNKKQSFKKFNR